MKVKSYCIDFTFFGVLGFLINGTLSAKGEGNCEIIDVNNHTLSLEEWEKGIDLESIDDVPKVKILHHYIVKNYSWIENIYNNQKKEVYIDFSMFEYIHEEEDWVVEIARYFSNYEDYETSTVLELRVTLLCTNNKYSEIEFRIPIIDSNNHNPEFLKKSYTFNTPMPIPKGFAIDFIEQITARDVDLTNEQITLNFEKKSLNEKFIISQAVQDSNDKKNYLTRIITAATIDLEEDLTFTLIATDSGEPPRTGNTTVNIIVDKQNSYPRFSHPLYTADLTKTDYEKDDKISIAFVEGNVTVTRGYQDIEKFEIREISDENKQHIKLTHSGTMSDYGLVTYVSLNNLTEEFLKQKVLNIVLAAVRRHVETTTVLQILLPESFVAKPNAPCKINEKTTELNDNSTNGFMVATIILSLISVGLTAFVIFLFLSKRINCVRN